MFNISDTSGEILIVRYYPFCFLHVARASPFRKENVEGLPTTLQHFLARLGARSAAWRRAAPKAMRLCMHNSDPRARNLAAFSYQGPNTNCVHVSLAFKG